MTLSLKDLCYLRCSNFFVTSTINTSLSLVFNMKAVRSMQQHAAALTDDFHRTDAMTVLCLEQKRRPQLL